MIGLHNRQRKIAIDLVAIEADAEKILTLLNYAGYDLGILITTNASIRSYNRDYRHKDKATDILSFPYHTELVAGRRIRVKSEDDKNLGDIIISAEYVAKKAAEKGVTFAAHMQMLLVHGVCHLLGYDHIEDHDWRRMRAKEAYILKQLR